MNTEDYLKEFKIDTSNYYYTEKGVLVYLEEKLSNNRFLVSHVHYVEYEDYSPESNNTFQGLENGTTFVYTGSLYKSENYSKLLLEHDGLKYQKARKEELEKAIASLSKELNELEKVRNMNKKQFEDNKTFLAAYNLLNNTSRFIVVRDSDWRCYIIDNLDKKYIPDQEEVSGDYDYYDKKYRYTDIEFTFYREFSSRTNPKDKLFNYSIKLTPEKEERKWRDDSTYIKPNSEGDIEFVNDYKELNLLLDNWLQESKLSPSTYLNLIQGSEKLKPSPFLGAKLKAQFIEREKNNIDSRKKSIRSYTEFLNQSNDLIDKLIACEDSDLETINSLIQKSKG